MPKKIFELAKELDRAPLDLVEELKDRGYSVRNHMTTLSDEEVEKILGEFKKEESEKKVETKAKVKKKAKKKVVKKKTTTAEGAVEAKSDKGTTTKKKTITRKKKTLIRKKNEEGESSEAVSTSSKKSALESDLAQAETLEKMDKASTLGKGETAAEKKERPTTGLRVVSRPEESEGSDDEEDARPRKAKVFSEEGDFDETSDDDDDDDDEKGKSKKRLGGLASMMSGKRPVVNKSQLINETRSESELKSYAAALSGAGRPLYTTVKRKKSYVGPTQKTEITEVKESKRVVNLHEGTTIERLAKKLSVKLKEMVDKCLDLNILIKADDYVGMGLASEIAALYNYRVENKAFDEDKVLGKTEEDKKKDSLPLRNPIITIMGHVDHGKTTLLDHIRKAKVAQGEAGGITQHIGAYSVKAKNKTLTFLDTPGHAAFASMRQRGANITDIVVLVVAADDGVMPQTKESIRFCQHADVPIIVAVNKMDKEGANPDRIKQELTEFELTPEEWGGETQYVPISALKGDGIDDLLENIALLAEMLELKADPKGKAEGVVIESKIEQGRGPVATVLIQAGTLKKGDSIVVGETFGRARSLTDHTGSQLNSAGPSTPVQILGLNEAPTPGDSLDVVKNEREAKKIIDNRVTQRKKLESTPSKNKVSLEDFFAQAMGEAGEQKNLNLIVRSDVQGSYEAIKQSVESLTNKEVEVKVIGGGVGPISDNDVNMASSAKGFILGFNMRPVSSARRLAEDKGVDIKTYSVIYELINDVKLAIEGLLDPEYVEEFIGRAEVKETFTVPKAGVIAGSQVTDGKIQVGCNVRLLRDGKIIHDGKMSSLKRFKDDAKEVKNGLECGIGLENYNDIKIGDLFECYLMKERKRTLEEIQKEEKRAEAEAAAAKLQAAEEVNSPEQSL